jgi:hypothetical protein
VRHFPRARLAPSAEARFRQLFGVRARWTRDALLPFLEPLAGRGDQAWHVKLDDLLVQHARVTVAAPGAGAGAAQRLFSAR